MKINHCGIIVDSEKPTTGVFNNNYLEWIFEDAMEGINLDWEQHLRECPNEDHIDCYEDIEPTYLIGYKLNKKTNLYEIDKEAEYSAIVNTDSNTTQVVHSKWFIYGALCSPCYPGQVDCDTKGDFLAYSVPPEVVEDLLPEMTHRIFFKGEKP